MATYGKDSKGDYKIRDDGSKVYRDSSNAKYFPTDYGGSAGWSTGSNTAAPKTTPTTSSNKKSSGGGSAGGSNWNYNDQNWNDPSWVNNYINNMISQGDAARSSEQDYMKYYNEAQRVKDASIQKGVLNPYNYVGGSSGGSKGPSSGGSFQQQVPSNPDEMLQYLWQQGFLNQTPYPEIPDYRPLEPEVLSFNQAQRRAQAQFDPLYDDLLGRVSTQSAQNLEQSGLFGSLYGEKLRQDAALNIENKRSADIAALANQLVSRSEEEARYLEQQNYGRWRDYVGDLVNQYSANRSAGQDQTALLAQMLGYLTDRDDNAFNRRMQEEGLGLERDKWDFQKDQAEWEKSGFGSQYDYQAALAKLEASLKPKTLKPKTTGSSSPYGDLDKTTTKNLNINYYQEQIDSYLNSLQRYVTNAQQAYSAIVKKIEEDKEQLILGGLSTNDIEKLKDYARSITGYNTGGKKDSNNGLDQTINSL